MFVFKVVINETRMGNNPLAGFVIGESDHPDK